MAESTSNVEFAHRIHEQGHHGKHTRSEWLEILEAIVLAAVAVLTAWSGYQAARWDARSAASYARASSTTVHSQEQLTLAGQERLYDISTSNAWLEAKMAGKEREAAIFERRFRPEYATAYAAWVRLDPLNNLKAPAGPIFMAEYRNAKFDEGQRLARQAATEFEEGVQAREKGDEYVRITVVLATVLLLTALSQR